MLMRYSEYKNLKRAIDFGRTDEYIDYYEIDYYAWEALTWAVTWNIMSGKGGATKSEQKIDPHGKVTHSEFEQTFNRMMQVNGLAAPSSFPTQPKEDVAADQDADKKDTDNKGDSDEASEVLSENSSEPSSELLYDDGIEHARGRGKSRNPLPFMLIAVAVLAVAGGVVAVVLFSRKKKEKNNTSGKA